MTFPFLEFASRGTRRSFQMSSVGVLPIVDFMKGMNSHAKTDRDESRIFGMSYQIRRRETTIRIGRSPSSIRRLNTTDDDISNDQVTDDFVMISVWIQNRENVPASPKNLEIIRRIVTAIRKVEFQRDVLIVLHFTLRHIFFWVHRALLCNSSCAASATRFLKFETYGR